MKAHRAQIESQGQAMCAFYTDVYTSYTYVSWCGASACVVWFACCGLLFWVLLVTLVGFAWWAVGASMKATQVLLLYNV